MAYDSDTTRTAFQEEGFSVIPAQTTLAEVLRVADDLGMDFGKISFRGPVQIAYDKASDEIPPLPPLLVNDKPVTFLFGFDDPFEDGGLYVWIVGEDYYREEGYIDDSSSASSVIPESKREALREQTDENGWDLLDKIIDEAYQWLDKATKGVLYGEGMESCWDTGWESPTDTRLAELAESLGIERERRYTSREDAIEKIKAALIKRGFKHDPRLDGELSEDG